MKRLFALLLALLMLLSLPGCTPEDPAETTNATEPSTEPTEPVQPPLDEATRSQLEASYTRTWAIVGDGLTMVQEYLQSYTVQVETELGVK